MSSAPNHDTGRGMKDTGYQQQERVEQPHASSVRHTQGHLRGELQAQMLAINIDKHACMLGTVRNLPAEFKAFKSSINYRKRLLLLLP